MSKVRTQKSNNPALNKITCSKLYWLMSHVKWPSLWSSLQIQPSTQWNPTIRQLHDVLCVSNISKSSTGVFAASSSTWRTGKPAPTVEAIWKQCGHHWPDQEKLQIRKNSKFQRTCTPYFYHHHHQWLVHDGNWLWFHFSQPLRWCEDIC